MTQLDHDHAALRVAKALQGTPVVIAPNHRTASVTIAMPLREAVWAADAQVRGDNFPVLLPTGFQTFGRVTDTTLSQEDRSVLHATIEVDL